MQIDFHYYATYCLARAAGIKKEAAQIIAYASQYVDDSVAADVDTHYDGSKVIAIPTAHHPSNIRNIDREHQRYIWIPFHFIPGGKGNTFTQKLVCRKDSPIAQEMVANNISQIDKPYILELVGITAHAYADTFAHYGFSGVSSRRNRVDGRSIKIENPSPLIENILGEKLTEFFSYYGMQGGLFSNIRSFISGTAEFASGALGHGAVSIYPDQPYLKWSFEYEFPKLCLEPKSIRNNQQTYFEGSKALYNMFKSFVALNPKYKDRKSNRNFEDFSNDLKELISLEANKDDRVKLWIKKANQSIFFDNLNNEMPLYNHKKWENQHHNFVNLKDSGQIVNTEIYRFYQAASYHRHYILRELLPKYKIIAV